MYILLFLFLFFYYFYFFLLPSYTASACNKCRPVKVLRYSCALLKADRSCCQLCQPAKALLKCFHFKPGTAAETLFYLILILCVKTQTPAVRNVPGHRVGLGLWFASDFEAAGEFELAHWFSRVVRCWCWPEFLAEVELTGWMKQPHLL